MTRVRFLWRDAENMTTVGFIGSGQLGSTIARLAIEAAHQVVLSNSRGPETLADTVAELGPRASAATSGEAAAAGDIVVAAAAPAPETGNRLRSPGATACTGPGSTS